MYYCQIILNSRCSIILYNIHAYTHFLGSAANEYIYVFFNTLPLSYSPNDDETTSKPRKLTSPSQVKQALS